MGRLVSSWRAHISLVLVVPALLCGGGALAQASPATSGAPPGGSPDQPASGNRQEKNEKKPEDRTHPVVDKVEFPGVTKVISKSDMAGGLATQASGCLSLLLEPFCAFTKSHLVYATRTLDHVELARDVVRIKVYYYKRGYREVEVDTLVTRAHKHTNRVNVVFRVREGAPLLIKSIAVIRPETTLSDRTIKRDVLVRKGKPLNLIDLDSTHVRLRNALWDKGYSDAEVADTIEVHDSTRTADVTIKVDPRWVATVESVTVHGDSMLSPDIAKKIISLRPGNIYKRENVIESQQNLYNSNLYRRATIVLPPRGDSAKLVDVNVNESRLHQVRLSAGFNTIEFVQTEARYTDYDWLGDARRLDLHAVLSNLLAPALNGTGIFRDVLSDNNVFGTSASVYLHPTYQASADVTQRWLGDPRNTVSGSIFLHRTSAPGIYVDKGYGASASFTRNITPRSPLSLTYRYELTQVQAGDVYFCVNYGVCQSATIGLLRNRNALSPVALNYYMDRTNEPLNPSSGYTARADFEHASKYTLSDFRYNRVTGDGTMFWPVGNKNVLAAHIRGGWVRALSSSGNVGVAADSSDADLLHPRKRFYAGGANSVRGYGENQLGPRILTVDPAKLIAAGCTTATITARTCDPNAGGDKAVAQSDFIALPTGGTSLLEGSVEYRFPFVMQNLQAAVFVDAGYVGITSSQAGVTGKAAITPGFGFRYLSPVGPIRLDLGIRPTLSEDLRVITQVIRPDGSRQLVELQTEEHYNPAAGSGFKAILNRLALHLSIGQAF